MRAVARLGTVLGTLDRALLKLYAGCGWFAAACLVLLTALVLASIVSRLAGVYLPGLVAYSGYAMAAASFFAFADAFRAGSHIRVSLVVNRLGPVAGRALDLGCLAAGSAIGLFFACYMTRLAWFSWTFGEHSEGADAILIFIPQSIAAAGAVIFGLSLVHTLIRVAAGLEPGAPRAAEPRPVS